MTRNAKLKIATLATALVATLGTAGLGAATASVDAGKMMKRDHSWCC